MNSKLSIILLLISAFIFSFIGCNNDDEPKTDTTSIVLEIGYPIQISLMEGNDDYSIVIGDQEIAEASYTRESKKNGILELNGKKQGKTTITVVDNITGDKLIINTEVIIHDFIIDEKEVNLTMFVPTDIFIQSGNRKYEITVKDKEIAGASIFQSSAQEDGKTYYGITFSGITPGSTEIYVKDIILDETITIHINVSFPYLSLVTEKVVTDVQVTDSDIKTAIETDLKENALFKDNYVYSMIRGYKNMPLYIFKNREDAKNGKIAQEGLFSFLVGADGYGLYYTVNDERHSILAQAPVSSYTTIFKLFDMHFISQAVTTVEDDKILLTEDVTEKYKKIYPSVKQVKIESLLKLETIADLSLPLGLTQND